MPDASASTSDPQDAFEVAERLAALLDAEQCDYSLGGAIALGNWTTPRGTLDVDVTLFLPPDKPTHCLRLLQRIGCDFITANAQAALVEHGYCEVRFHGWRLDIFLPTIDFYAVAKARRRQMRIGTGYAWIWDPETLCVFKMMFFRRKDFADVEAMLREQGSSLDRSWVEQQLLEMYGQRDPRINQWRELVAETKPTAEGH